MQRREFLEKLGTYAALAGLSASAGAGILATETTASAEPCLRRNKRSRYDAKGLPTVVLGRTGAVVPKMVLGLGSRFCHIDTDEEAWEMLNFALDNGLYYWDTAHAYDNSLALPKGKPKPTNKVYSEIRIAEVLKTRRKEVYLSTKVSARNPDEALAEIEDSLKRLGTDHLEELKIHSVNSLEDVEEMSRPGHLIDIVRRMKDEKVCDHIGFSCHADAYAAKAMCDRGDFDTMLIAMNQWDASHYSNREGIAIPAAKAQRMGVMLMKLVRPKENRAGIDIPTLIKYAMSLDGPDAVCIGMDSHAIVQSNLDILRNFKKYSAAEMKQLAEALGPF